MLSSSLYIDPDIAVELSGPPWLHIFASSLLALPSSNVHDVAQLCNLLLDGEFDNISCHQWAMFPRVFKAWLAHQDGLKVDGIPITSMEGLVTTHGLVRRRPVVDFATSGLTTSKMFLDIIAKYYQNLIRGFKTTVEDLVIRGTMPMQRKCSICNSRLLDDSFPRYKKSDPTRYVAHNIKSGCGAPSCEGRQGRAVPLDDSIPWQAGRRHILERAPLRADWTDVLLRKDWDDRRQQTSIQIICKSCNNDDSIYEDIEPRWTIESTPRYVVRKPRCKVCNKNGITWRPVDDTIPWLDQAAISKMWKKQKDKNWDLEDVIRDPAKYFPKTREEWVKNKHKGRRARRNIRFRGQ